jgi:small subunit ribosomal protein S17
MATDVTTQDQTVAEDSRNMRKEITGTVTSSKMDKSITVRGAEAKAPHLR